MASGQSPKLISLMKDRKAPSWANTSPTNRSTSPSMRSTSPSMRSSSPSQRPVSPRAAVEVREEDFPTGASKYGDSAAFKKSDCAAHRYGQAGQLLSPKTESSIGDSFTEADTEQQPNPDQESEEASVVESEMDYPSGAMKYTDGRGFTRTTCTSHKYGSGGAQPAPSAEVQSAPSAEPKVIALMKDRKGPSVSGTSPTNRSASPTARSTSPTVRSTSPTVRSISPSLRSTLPRPASPRAEAGTAPLPSSPTVTAEAAEQEEEEYPSGATKYSGGGAFKRTACETHKYGAK